MTFLPPPATTTTPPPDVAEHESDLVRRLLAVPLPPGPVLVLATGTSAAPVALARAGHVVEAVDRSAVAIAAVGRRVHAVGLTDLVTLRVADLDHVDSVTGRYAAVVAERFWSAPVFARAISVIVPGGVIAWSALDRPRPGSATGGRWVPPAGAPASLMPAGWELLLTDTVQSADHPLRRLMARRSGGSVR